MEFFLDTREWNINRCEVVTVLQMHPPPLVVALEVLSKIRSRYTDYRSDLTIVLIFSIQSSFFLVMLVSVSINCCRLILPGISFSKYNACNWL